MAESSLLGSNMGAGLLLCRGFIIHLWTPSAAAPQVQLLAGAGSSYRYHGEPPDSTGDAPCFVNQVAMIAADV